MKETVKRPIDNGKKTYLNPTMEVEQHELQAALLVGISGGQPNSLDIKQEEEWPVDPETEQPFAPW